MVIALILQKIYQLLRQHAGTAPVPREILKIQLSIQYTMMNGYSADF